jgi:hypothetical protein
MLDASRTESPGEDQGNFFTEDSARQVEGFRDGADTTESTMDSDQTGNGPNQSEIEFLYDEALTAFAHCTGLKAKRDEALKNAIAKTKLLHEIVGPDNWEPLLKRKKIRGVGKATGSFQPWVKHGMGVTSDEGGWVSRVASVLEEAVEKNIPGNRIAEWITETPNGINGISKLRSRRKQAEERAAKGLPPLPSREQQHIAYDDLLSLGFIIEYELPEAWRDHEDTDPVTRVAADAFEVALAARFEKGKVKIRGYFVPRPNFWIGKADELLRSRSAEPPLASSFEKNFHAKPSEVDEATDGVDESLNSQIDEEPLAEGAAVRDDAEHLERPASPSIGARPRPQDSTEAVIDKSSLTPDRVEPPKLQDFGALVCRALGGRCRHKTCGQRRHCLAARGTKAWATRIRHQIWDAKEKGEIISHEEAHTRVGARMRRRSRKTAADGEWQTTSSGS